MNEPQNAYINCFISVPPEDAQRIARLFVTQKCAACVQIIHPVHSIYRWQGEVKEDTEALLLLKTRTALTEKIKTLLKEIHPYEVPELIIIPVQDGYEPYLSWVDKVLL
jgi:periplasmic divalent cation tolerance protein